MKKTDFQHKKIWITGASSGIGEHLAYAFAEEGAHIIISGRNEKELQRVKDNCTKAASVVIYPLDLAKTEEAMVVAKRVLERYGMLDILVNNAGISQRALARETSMAVTRQLMEVNYIGTVAISKVVMENMIQHQHGQIVVVSSLVGRFGSPMRSAYAASKHALHGYFDSLRAELHDENVFITLLCPGFVRTNISLNALTGDGTAQQKMDDGTDKGMLPNVFARKALRAIKFRKEEAYIGGKETWAIYLKRFFPKIFSRVLRKAKVV